MTTVSPPPNWYADPTGRHETRFWDGFTWTAHVADGGAPGVDPLVRPAPVAGGAPGPAPPSEPIGPGTAQLRVIAEAREAATAAAAADRPASPVAAPRRRVRGYEVAAAVAVFAVLALGALLAWTGWRDSRDGRGPGSRDAGTWTGDGYALRLPPSWVDADVPVTADPRIDGAFQVIDAGTLVALVADQPGTLAQLPDAERLTQHLRADIQAGAAISGTDIQVVATDVLEHGARLIGVVHADVTAPDGRVLRAVEYLVVDPERSVLLLLIGETAAVDRHTDEALAAARSVEMR